MFAIITKNILIYSRQEVWFYNGEGIEHTSNDMFYQSFIIPKFKIKNLQETQTTLINLLENSDTLFKDIKPNYRNEIRRAEKLNPLYQVTERANNKDLQNYLN